MEKPSAESIKKRVEDLTGIVDWVAEIWHGKNWVRRLLLLDVLLLTAFYVLKRIPEFFILDNYSLYIWAVAGLFFFVALIIGIRAKSVRPAPPPDKRSPINRDAERRTPIISASSAGNVDEVDRLLKAGADPNGKVGAQTGVNPLLLPSFRGGLR